MNTEKLRADFESWASGYFAEGLNAEWCLIDERYDDSIVQYSWDSYQAAHAAQQAEIDRLMLEFCPSEMTTEQMETWSSSQRRSEYIDEDHIYENL